MKMVLFRNMLRLRHRTDLAELSVDGADEGDRVLAGRGDVDGWHSGTGPCQRRLPPDRVRPVDWMIHSLFTAVRVVDRERLYIARDTSQHFNGFALGDYLQKAHYYLLQKRKSRYGCNSARKLYTVTYYCCSHRQHSWPALSTVFIYNKNVI